MHACACVRACVRESECASTRVCVHVYTFFIVSVDKPSEHQNDSRETKITREFICVYKFNLNRTIRNYNITINTAVY